ncbi:hypothetical protein VNN41_09775 [Lactococcus garvieae]|uniref:hypothetical protein n=1 Tax=Lactococcus garvieae TaxID=1363 RepID=UPI003250757D
MSLEARGLLAYMESMPDDYVFHKTQLYKCFDKNRKTSVERIWNELLDNRFILAFSKGSGPRQKFEYLFTHESFSEQDILELNKQYFSEGWGVAYRSGTNRKPKEVSREKTAKVEKMRGVECSNHEGVENQHPDNSGISLGVDFEQLNVNSSKPTDNKLTNKGFILNGDEEEEKIKKENSNESQEQDWKQAVENQKREILEEFGELIGRSLIDEAVENTSNNLFDIAYYDSYLFIALQKAVEKHQKLTVVPQKELNERIVSFSPDLLNPNNFK